ncbi:hypothetical protein HDV05_008297 [Chytridiales sp. JEL 0842]|nr:hypothetical protein HDV05_008297 [Chytridiales sp. JEL 0842]
MADDIQPAVSNMFDKYMEHLASRLKLTNSQKSFIMDVFKDIQRSLTTLPEVCRVTLGGSIAKETETQFSDLDVVVFYNGDDPSFREDALKKKVKDKLLYLNQSNPKNKNKIEDSKHSECVIKLKDLNGVKVDIVLAICTINGSHKGHAAQVTEKMEECFKCSKSANKHNKNVLKSLRDYKLKLGISFSEKMDIPKPYCFDPFNKYYNYADGKSVNWGRLSGAAAETLRRLKAIGNKGRDVSAEAFVGIFQPQEPSPTKIYDYILTELEEVHETAGDEHLRPSRHLSELAQSNCRKLENVKLDRALLAWLFILQTFQQFTYTPSCKWKKSFIQGCSNLFADNIHRRESSPTRFLTLFLPVQSEKLVIVKVRLESVGTDIARTQTTESVSDAVSVVNQRRDSTVEHEQKRPDEVWQSLYSGIYPSPASAVKPSSEDTTLNAPKPLSRQIMDTSKVIANPRKTLMPASTLNHKAQLPVENAADYHPSSTSAGSLPTLGSSEGLLEADAKVPTIEAAKFHEDIDIDIDRNVELFLNQLIAEPPDVDSIMEPLGDYEETESLFLSFSSPRAVNNSLSPPAVSVSTFDNYEETSTITEFSRVRTPTPEPIPTPPTGIAQKWMVSFSPASSTRTIAPQHSKRQFTSQGTQTSPMLALNTASLPVGWAQGSTSKIPAIPRHSAAPSPTVRNLSSRTPQPYTMRNPTTRESQTTPLSIFSPMPNAFDPSSSPSHELPHARSKSHTHTTTSPQPEVINGLVSRRTQTDTIQTLLKSAHRSKPRNAFRLTSTPINVFVFSSRPPPPAPHIKSLRSEEGHIRLIRPTELPITHSTPLRVLEQDDKHYSDAPGEEDNDGAEGSDDPWDPWNVEWENPPPVELSKSSPAKGKKNRRAGGGNSTLWKNLEQRVLSDEYERETRRLELEQQAALLNQRLQEDYVDMTRATASSTRTASVNLKGVVDMPENHHNKSLAAAISLLDAHHADIEAKRIQYWSPDQPVLHAETSAPFPLDLISSTSIHRRTPSSVVVERLERVDLEGWFEGGYVDEMNRRKEQSEEVEEIGWRMIGEENDLRSMLFFICTE